MKIESIIRLFILGILVVSCNKDNDDDSIYGTYLLTGKKITSIYPVWPPTMGEQPTLDTSDITFTIRIEESQNKKDSIRFYGLEKANQVYQEGPNCSDQYYCGVYAMIINNQLTFDLQAPGGKYNGTGRIFGDSIELDTKWNYRPSTFFYKLKGKKQ